MDGLEGIPAAEFYHRSTREPRVPDENKVRDFLRASAEIPPDELARRLVTGDSSLLPGERCHYRTADSRRCLLASGHDSEHEYHEDETPRRTSTSIRLPTEVHHALAAAAVERGLSINFLVVTAVREFLERLIPAEEVRYTRESR